MYAELYVNMSYLITTIIPNENKLKFKNAALHRDMSKKITYQNFQKYDSRCSLQLNDLICCCFEEEARSLQLVNPIAEMTLGLTQNDFYK